MLRSVTPRRAARLLAIVCVLCAGVCAWIGANYIPRLSDHRGYFLVDVPDAVEAEPPARPRTTTLVVVDGLRRDAARSMDVVARLAARGQCRDADVGPYTVSRPIYALLSTGLEVDRSGARNNDETSPLRAESVWEVAVQAGLSAGVASHLPWWHQLFPRALQPWVDVDKDDDVFEASAALDTDLTVIHPVYVDTAGHDAGGDSPEYRAAVARADAEASAWLDARDLARDLVIFTADHGHVDAGGHGARQPDVATVLVCFAGPGIAHRVDAPKLDSRVIAPAIAVSLGLR
ncbi:MAG: alkaline phosphatase family protein, partial [Myxococcota bacterium]